MALESDIWSLFLDVSDCLGAVLDRVFQTAPGRGVSAPCNFGNSDRRKPFAVVAAKDVIAGYMSAVNGVRSRLNEAYDGTLALYQASASAMQMTVFFGFILFLLAGLLSAGICYRTNPAVVLAGEFPVLAGIGIAGGTPSFFSFF